MEFVIKTEKVNSTNEISYINHSLASPTDLRLNDNYVIFYVNLARLLVQGIFPFVILSLLNYRIYWVIKRRRQMTNRPAATAVNKLNQHTSAQRKANETQQAVVLFIIVLLFFICHTLRFVLNVHEFLTLESLRKSIENDCNDVSLWALLCASVSNCLMTTNSSVNFFIYCFMCATFRQQLFEILKKLSCYHYIIRFRHRNDSHGNIELNVEEESQAAGMALEVEEDIERMSQVEMDDEEEFVLDANCQNEQQQKQKVTTDKKVITKRKLNSTLYSLFGKGKKNHQNIKGEEKKCNSTDNGIPNLKEICFQTLDEEDQKAKQENVLQKKKNFLETSF